MEISFKFAILFPGQGSQKVGMGRDLFEQTEIAKELFKKVDYIVGRELTNIFLNGPEEELNQTKNTQVSIVTVSLALVLLLQEELKSKKLNFKPIACSGHSLGELTSLWFLNILSLEDLIKLVSLRGNLMQNAPGGAMAAILNLQLEKIEELLKEEEFKNKMVIANYNSPNQFVISGEKEAINKTPEKIKLLGGKAIILPVSGAFHSPLMKESSKAFSIEIDKLQESKTNITTPIYQNYDGKPTKDYKVIIEKLKKQMTSPVFWTQTINNLVNDGVKAVVEIGPGKVLTGLTKKINPDIDCYNIFDIVSLKEFISNYELKLTTTKS